MHGKGFAVVYPASKAMERDPLTVSSSEKLVPVFLQAFILLVTSNEQFSGDPWWQSTSSSILHLILKLVLGMPMYHSTEYCPLTGGPRSIQCSGTAVVYSVEQTLPSVGKLAHKTRWIGKCLIITFTFHIGHVFST